MGIPLPPWVVATYGRSHPKVPVQTYAATNPILLLMMGAPVVTNDQTEATRRARAWRRERDAVAGTWPPATALAGERPRQRAGGAARDGAVPSRCARAAARAAPRRNTGTVYLLYGPPPPLPPPQTACGEGPSNAQHTRGSSALCL